MVGSISQIPRMQKWSLPSLTKSKSSERWWINQKPSCLTGRWSFCLQMTISKKESLFNSSRPLILTTLSSLHLECIPSRLIHSKLQFITQLASQVCRATSQATFKMRITNIMPVGIHHWMLATWSLIIVISTNTQACRYTSKQPIIVVHRTA